MGVRSYIDRLESTYRERVLFHLVVRLAWVFVAVALLYIALDAAFAFSGAVRLGLDAAAAIGLVACVAWSARMAFRSRARARMLVRLIEAGNPSLENHLTNALDFDERLEAGDAERFSRALMEREIASADEQATGIADYGALTPPTLKRESGLLAGLVAAFILGAILFHAVYLAVVPRYLLPFGDFPPYSAIRFAVAPGDVTVDFGDSLKIEVTAWNTIPDDLTLVLLDEHGGERESVGMHDAGEGNFFQTLENLRAPVTYLARAGRGRTRMYHVDINAIPRIEEVVVDYTYPAYTNLDPETRILSDDVLKGYAETQVTMSIRSNRPLQGGEIAVNDARYTFQAGPEANIVEAVFPLKEAGTYTAGVVDIDGHAAQDLLRGTVEIIPDAKPEVTIATPGMDSFAVADSEIPILVDASDDLGIANVTIYRRHNESSDERKPIYEDAGRASFVTVDETLHLKDLGVRPGDTIDYYATASDSRPGAPQTATSEMYRLLIISFEEYREYAQSQMTAEDLREKYEAIQEEMEALAEAQKKLKEQTDALREKLAEEGALSEAEQEQLAQAEQEQAALAGEAAEMAERLEEMAERPVVFDIEEEYKEALRDFAERLAAANEKMAEASTAMAGDTDRTDPSAESLERASAAQQEALEQLAQNMQQFQEGIQQANENLENVANVMSDVERFKYLYSLQKSLERSIGYYKTMENIGAEDRVRLDELSVQQADVMASLAELKEDLRAHADELDALAAKQKGTSNVFEKK